MLQYWDANLFLYRINSDNENSRVVGNLYELARSGEHPIATSEISVVEVAFAERERRDPTIRDGVLAEINALLYSSPAVELIPIDAGLLEEARELVRRAAFARGTGGLQAADAIHLAAAARANAGVFFTYDDRLLRAPRVIEVPLQKPAAGWL